MAMVHLLGMEPVVITYNAEIKVFETKFPDSATELIRGLGAVISACDIPSVDKFYMLTDTLTRFGVLHLHYCTCHHV